MIVNVRGTHGSGKSTLVRQVMARYPTDPVREGAAGKPLGYRVEVPWLARPLYVVGSYETACGGCDAIQPYSEIWPRVERFAASGHVLFEGALVSSSYGTIGAASEALGPAFVFAFLDTPAAVCVARIAARRAAKGNDKPVNPHHCERIHRSNAGVLVKVKDKGRRYVILNHHKALAQLLALLRRAEEGEP